MVLKDPDGDIKRIESTPSVTSGLSTIIASEFDFGADGLEPGTQGLLEISLLSADDNCVLAFLSEELVVPHLWAARNLSRAMSKRDTYPRLNELGNGVFFSQV